MVACRCWPAVRPWRGAPPRDRVGIHRVGLASPWPVADTRARVWTAPRYLGHRFTVGDRALGDVPADTVAGIPA